MSAEKKRDLNPEPRAPLMFREGGKVEPVKKVEEKTRAEGGKPASLRLSWP